MFKYKKRVRVASEESDDEGDDYDSTLVRNGSHIFFYCDVSSKSVLRLFKLLTEANQEGVKVSPPQVTLHLHSHGGDAYAGLAAYHHLLDNPIPVTTVVDGMVASAATFLLLAGSMRIAKRFGFVLIHQVSTGFFGKYNDMIDEMQNTHDLMQTFRKMYLSHTSLTEERLESLLRSERALDASTCLNDGIVHVIQNFTSENNCESSSKLPNNSTSKVSETGTTHVE